MVRVLLVICNYLSKNIFPNGEKGLFIRGLSCKTSKEAIIEYFSSFGEVVDCDLPVYPDSGKLKGFAFVTFKNSNAAQTALSRGPHIIDGRHLIVELAEPSIKAKKSNRVFVGGIRDIHTKTVLQLFFSRFGSVGDVDILYDKMKGKCRGFAFILFNDSSAVDKVLSQRMFTIEGHACEVKPAFSSNKQIRDGRNKGQHIHPLRTKVSKCSKFAENFKANFEDYGKCIVPDGFVHKIAGYGNVSAHVSSTCQSQAPSVRLFSPPLYNIPFSYWQRTPPPQLVPKSIAKLPSMHTDAITPISVPCYTQNRPQGPMTLPPFQYIDYTPECSIGGPIIYQEFQPNVTYEPYYAV